MLMYVWHEITEDTPRGRYLLYYPKEEGRNALNEWFKHDVYPTASPRKPTHYMVVSAPEKYK